jgi:hypothetical protein
MAGSVLIFLSVLNALFCNQKRAFTGQKNLVKRGGVTKKKPAFSFLLLMCEASTVQKWANDKQAFP